MNRSELDSLLSNNVLLLSFRRRTDPVGFLRRMICTKSNYILSSFSARAKLNFRPPKYGGTKFDQKKLNLVVVWDILMEDYRCVPCETVKVMEVVPEKKFWAYYSNNIEPMNKRSRETYMRGKNGYNRR